MSGILGLAYRSISVNDLPTFVDSAELDTTNFAMYLNLDTEGDSYMTIPGYDESKMNGQNWTFHEVKEEKYYSLGFTSMQQNG